MTSTENRPNLTVVPPVPAGRCPLHRAYDADYCPSCGTARRIGTTGPVR